MSVLVDILEARWTDMTTSAHGETDAILAALARGSFEEREPWLQGQTRVVNIDADDIPYTVVFEFVGRSTKKMRDILNQKFDVTSAMRLANGMDLVNASPPGGAWKTFNVMIQTRDDNPPSDEDIKALASDPMFRKMLVHETTHVYQHNADGERFWTSVISATFPTLAGLLTLALTMNIWVAGGLGWMLHLAKERFPRIANRWENKDVEMEAVVAESAIEELAVARDGLIGKLSKDEAIDKLKQAGFFRKDYFEKVMVPRIEAIGSEVSDSGRTRMLSTRLPELRRRAQRMQHEIGKALTA